MSDPRIPRLAAEWNRQKADLIAYDPDLLGDELALTDTLDGITDAGDFIAYWCRKAREDGAMADALSDMIGEMQMRKNRLLARAERQRDLALQLMDAIGERRIVRPDLTISVQPGRANVIISDEATIPDSFCKTVRIPDKTAIKEALENGETVAGASLSNGGQTLVLRSK